MMNLSGIGQTQSSFQVQDRPKLFFQVQDRPRRVFRYRIDPKQFSGRGWTRSSFHLQDRPGVISSYWTMDIPGKVVIYRINTKQFLGVRYSLSTEQYARIGYNRSSFQAYNRPGEQFSMDKKDPEQFSVSLVLDKPGVGSSWLGSSASQDKRTKESDNCQFPNPLPFIRVIYT